MTPSLDKLPKWARQEIQQLRHNVTVLRQQLFDMDAGLTNVRFDAGQSRREYVNLPMDTRVEFLMEPDPALHARFTVYLGHDEGDYLEVYCGGDALHIEPRAPNVARIYRAEKR